MSKTEKTYNKGPIGTTSSTLGQKIIETLQNDSRDKCRLFYAHKPHVPMSVECKLMAEKSKKFNKIPYICPKLNVLSDESTKFSQP